MGCRPAPACSAALEEATSLWPRRSRRSDGICGDAAHRARKSDHNPDWTGFAHAFDITDDPANGCHAHVLARAVAARRDWRVKYIISQGQIWNPATGWRKYTGPNPHNQHAHFSIKTIATFSRAPWFNLKPEEVMAQVNAVRQIETKTGKGYWQFSEKGQVYSFGDAVFYGAVDFQLPAPIVDVYVTRTGKGYLMMDASFNNYAYGDAKQFPAGGKKGQPVNAASFKK